MEHRIKDILREQGLTQKDLAERLGMSLQQLNNTVSGRNTASMAVYERIADALGVAFWQLFAPEGVTVGGDTNGVPEITCPRCGAQIRLKVEEGGE